MRKVLLLASLCMALALVLSAPAMAQSAEGNPCGGFEPGSPEAAQCYADLGVEPPGGDVGLATSVPPSESASPSADPCPDPNFPRETPDGCQASDLPDVSFGDDVSPTASPTASPTVSPTASATASASASVSALPETGGPVSVLALGSLALLVGSGIMAFGLIRRS